MNSKSKLMLAGGVAMAGMFAIAGVGAWYIATYNVSVTGNIQGASDYEPTSVWMEEGLDPDVTTFGFGSGDQEPSGPELSEGELQRLVNARQNDLMGCYASGLQEDDELQGRLDFQFGIAPDGHVALVKVTRSTMESKSTEDCMVEKARAWSFPPTNRATLMKFDTDFTFVYE